MTVRPVAFFGTEILRMLPALSGSASTTERSDDGAPAGRAIARGKSAVREVIAGSAPTSTGNAASWTGRPRSFQKLVSTLWANSTLVLNKTKLKAAATGFRIVVFITRIEPNRD